MWAIPCAPLSLTHSTLLQLSSKSFDGCLTSCIDTDPFVFITLATIAPLPTSPGPSRPARLKHAHIKSPSRRVVADLPGAPICCAVALCLIFILAGVLLLPGHAPPDQQGEDGRLGTQPLQRPQGVQPLNLTGDELVKAVSRLHPLNRLQCGSWVQSYTQLHKDILEGRAPQRYSIMRSKQEFGNGLADRLATSVSILLYSILTNRAFLYDWDPPPPAGSSASIMQSGVVQGGIRFYEPSTHLWKALRSDYIDWRYFPVDIGNDTVLMDYNMDKNMEEYKEFFRSQNLTALGEGKHSVIWHADHAGVWASFNNPFLKDRLAALGFTQNTAFACLFDYLYRPVPEIIEMFKPELNVLLNPDILKIGVQVRVGDWQLCDSYSFKPQHFPYLFRHYFECAQEIEDALKKPGQQVVWYTLVDIPELRDGLAKRYPDKLLINTNVVVEHIVKSKSTSDRGFFMAVGELWVFSFTSQHIITKISGFGKVPGMLNANPDNRHFYTIDYPMNFFNLVALNNRKNLAFWKGRKCGPQHADPIDRVCNDFTGI